MTTKTTPKVWMLSLLSALCMLVAFTACSSSSDSEDIGTPVIDIGEVINNPTKVKQYENTKQFQSDLDALVTYAISLQTYCQAALKMVKNSILHQSFLTRNGEPTLRRPCMILPTKLHRIVSNILKHLKICITPASCQTPLSLRREDGLPMVLISPFNADTRRRWAANR